MHLRPTVSACEKDVLVACVVGALLLCAAAGLGSDRDSVLVAYWLTSAEEGVFAAEPGVTSAFWTQWDQRDSAVLTTAMNSFPGTDGWDGEGDAGLVSKAAGGMHGLYLLVLTWDDSWVDTAGEDQRADRLSIWVDDSSSTALWACLRYGCRASALGGAASTTTTIYTLNHLVQGVSTDRFTLWKWDQDLMCGLCPRQVTVAEAEHCFGMQIRVLQTNDTTKVVEMRIPWWFIGVRSQLCDTNSAHLGVVPGRGTRKAFALGYDDLDWAGDELRQMGWLGRTPWYDDTCYWGDLVFGPGFPPVPTPVESLLTVQPSTWQRHRSAETRHMVTSEAFTLTGRRLERAHVASSVREARVTIVRQGGATKLRVRGGGR